MPNMVAEDQFTMRENQGTHYAAVDMNVVNSMPAVYIFSIDTEPHIVSKGGRGEFVIPAREEGKRVSTPLKIYGMHPEHMHLGGPISPVNYEPGIKVAEDIVGTNSQDKGLGRHTSNLEWHGVFITNNEVPTEKELQAAQAKRRQYLERLVADADAKFMRGKQGEIDAPERAAAHELHLKKSWAEKPTAMDSCGACGSAVVPGVAVCPNCTAVLDEEKARKFFPERFAKPDNVLDGSKVAAKRA